VSLYGCTYICNLGIRLSYGDFDMKCILEQMSERSGVVDPLDGVCLSTRDHERAKASMRKADMLTDSAIRVAADIRAAVARIERRVGEFTRRIRAMLVKPARN
jgi:hypothetical protein